MECSENFLNAVLNRGVDESEANGAQTNVRKHTVGPDVIGQDGSCDKTRQRGRHAPDAEREVCEARKRCGEVVRSDGTAVDEKVPAAAFTTLCEVNERTRAIVDVNRCDQWAGLSKLEHPASSGHRLDDPFAKPGAVAVHPSWKRGDNRQSRCHVAVQTVERRREASAPG